MKYTIKGLATPPSFKNGKIIIHVKGIARLITRADRKKWMKCCVAQLVAQRKANRISPAQRETGRVDVQKARFVAVNIQRATGRMADLDGALNTIMDCLVKAQIIADDSPRYVQSVEAKWSNGDENITEINVW